MPRQARLRIAGLPLHVIQRGNNKGPCFHDEGDFRLYLSLLDELSSLHGCEVHAYVLMTNHVHLLLSPTRPEGASPMMKLLGQRFVQRINRKYMRSGRLFEDRFRSCLIDSDAYLLACQRYVEMNPVRAGIVNHPRDYKWSSYLVNAEGLASTLVVPHPIYLGLAGEDEDRRRRYRLMYEIGEPPAELQRIREAINSGKALVRQSVLDRFDAQMRERLAVRGPGRPRRARGGMT